MKIIRTANYEEMSIQAANIIIDRVRNNPAMTLGLATGSTPEGVYKLMIKDHLENYTSYKNITTVNLDEYVGLEPSHPSSYNYFMRDKLFNHIDIPQAQTHLPNGIAEDIEKECTDYEALLQKLGGPDLQLLGIGENGHIGFNEPGTSFTSLTHVVNLREETRQVNSRFFPSIDDVPTKAISMGIVSISRSKEIILLASGKAKAQAMSDLINGETGELIPASSLKHHKNFTIIADEEALALVPSHL